MRPKFQLPYPSILSAAILTLLTACAPGLSGSLELMPIPAANEAPASVRARAATIHMQVRPFVDARPASAIAEIKGRDVQPAGDITTLVQSAFESRLRDLGIDAADPNAPVVGAQIDTWHVKVQPNFPASEASAQAVITVEVSTIDNQLMFQGRYSGQTTVQHPLLTEVRIAQALSQAMAYALDEALKDERLLGKISRVYRPIY